MSVKKGWVSAAITLIICTCGWCQTEASRTNQQHRATRIGRRNTSFDNQSKQTRLGSARLGAGSRSQAKPRQTVDLSALTLDTTFSDAIEILRNSTEPPLKIVVLWRDLRENADVERDTPIYIEGVSGISLRTGLKILLRSVSSGLAELDYVVDKGIIIVGTKDSLPAKMVVRIYDISYLVGRPAAYGFNFGGGFARGWPMRANSPWDPLRRGGIGPGDIRGRRTYGRGVRRGTRGGTATIWGQSRRVREQNEMPQLIKYTIRPGSWR